MIPISTDTLLWPLGLYALLVFGLVGLMLAIPHFLGERHRARTTGEPYESGVRVVGPAWVPRDVSFYLVAVFFVIFDLEAVFIFAWAVAVKELGWLGYIEVLIFIGVLLAGLAYLWRIGALESGPRGRGL
ncbi:MAG: NADH-quinone oxidoreductase subunit A [Desulfomonile sp.]|nr:NADH-quinone oxidoreductase subunit A [Desulfomonile sp.]